MPWAPSNGGQVEASLKGLHPSVCDRPMDASQLAAFVNSLLWTLCEVVICSSADPATYWWLPVNKGL